MRKCPNCAEENITESLFCKSCGRVLLPPDPIKIDLSNSQGPEADRPGNQRLLRRRLLLEQSRSDQEAPEHRGQGDPGRCERLEPDFLHAEDGTPPDALNGFTRDLQVSSGRLLY